MSEPAELTIFYDGACPLCNQEMHHLRALDTSKRIDFFDISTDLQRQRLIQEWPDIEFEQAYRILHGKLPNGELLKGLDVTHKAWSLVGRGFFTAPLRWPLVAPIADRLYLVFAGNRQSISRWFSKTRKPSCRTCSIKERQ